MKTLLTATISLVILLLSTGCLRYDRENVTKDQLQSDIEHCLNEALAGINDSAMQEVMIRSIDANPEYDVKAGTPVMEKPGVVKVDVYVDKSDPHDWFVGYVAILAIIMGPIVPILTVWIICYFIFKSKRDRNRIIAMAIERNLPIPSELSQAGPERRPRLQSAVNYLAWGIGLTVFFQIADRPEIASLMLIPIIIGLGKLFSYIMYERAAQKSRRNENSDSLTDDSNAY